MKFNTKFLYLILVSFLLALFVLIFSNEFKAQFFIVKNVETKRAEEKFNEEELKEKIGQMIMVGFRGTSISEASSIVKAIQDLKLGGVILFDFDVPSKSFPRNILNPEQTKRLISDLQEISPTPLFIAVDAEGGKINRLKARYGFLEILSPKELGKRGDKNLTEKESFKLSKQLKDLGFNMNFAPVVDLNLNPQNPIIGKLGRSFSSDPEEVFLHSKIFIENHLQNDIIPIVKHFPGHGSSFADSHLEIANVSNSWNEEELIPYKKLNKENLLFGVIVGHIFNSNIDKDYPASLSEIFLQKILREEINFKGVIISDDMQMKAITKHYGMEEAIIKAINAGVDILLFSNNSELQYDEKLPYKVFDIIYQAVKEGKIKNERIIEASERIFNLKKEFGIIK